MADARRPRESSSFLWHAIERRGDRDQRLARLTAALSTLTHRDILHRGDLALALQTITETAAEALQVERVGVWSFTPDRLRLRCLDLYERGKKVHSVGLELEVAKYPVFFEEAGFRRIIPAHDARRDPVTCEFAEDCLVPNGIASLLEAPVHEGGRLMGVVCHEQAFAASIADLVSLALEAADRRRAEEEAESTRLKLSDFVENANLGMLWTGPDGSILWANQAFLGLLECAAEQCLGRKFSELAADAGQARDFLGRLAANERLDNHAIDLRCADGSVRHVLVNASVLWNKGSYVHARCFVRDVTDRRQAETHRRDLETQLRQAQKMEAVGRLTGGVAHDFNNILTAIGGYGELLLTQTPEEEPRRPYVQEILLAGERAATLTRQLLAFSRKQVLQPAVLDLDVVVAALVPMLVRLIGENIDCTVSAGAERRRVKADRGQIEQVLMNLAVNARDAMPQGGTLAIRTSYREAGAPRGMPPGAYVVLEVVDSGIGMGEETRAHLFEPFYTTKESGHGTGLGLATVYGIIRQSEGHIEVESASGRGSTFRIYLPVTLDPAQAPGGSPGVSAIVGSGETILVVEDNEVIRKMTRGILELNGYRVLDARDGSHALVLAEGHRGRIDLLLADVVLPGISGVECAKRLVQGRPSTPVLYMSGYTEEAVLSQGVLPSTTPYLQKPYSPTTLAVKVAEVLRKTGAAPGAHR